MALSIARDNLLACSSIVNERVTYLTEHGYDFRDDRCVDIVRKIMEDTVPDIKRLYKERVVVEAGVLYVLNSESMRPFDSGVFSAKLGRISIEQVISRERLEGFDEELVDLKHDIGLLFQPAITDADPVDLIFGDKIIVTMSYLEKLELAV